MAARKQHFELIASLYETAIDVEKWPEVLDRLAPLIGAKSSALLLVSANSSYNYSISASNSLLPESLKAKYTQEYSIKSP